MSNDETVRPATQGQVKDVAATLIGAIPKLTFDDAEFITGKKDVLVNRIRKAFSEVIKLQSPVSIIRIMNDFDTAIRAGAYDCVYEEINAKNFPVTNIKVETVEVKLFYFESVFKYGVNTNHVLTEMKKEEYEAGRIEHLLAFEAENPHAVQFITALGSSFYHTIEKRKVYPAIWTVTKWGKELRKDAAKRTLGWQKEGEYGWSEEHCFIGFRKIRTGEDPKMSLLR